MRSSSKRRFESSYTKRNDKINEKHRIAIALGLALGMFAVVSDAWSVPSASSCTCSGEDCSTLQGLLDSGSFFCAAVTEIPETTPPTSSEEIQATPTGDAFTDYSSYMLMMTSPSTPKVVTPETIPQAEFLIPSTLDTDVNTLMPPPPPPPPPTPPACSNPSDPAVCMQEMMDWYEEYWESMDDTSL